MLASEKTLYVAARVRLFSGCEPEAMNILAEVEALGGGKRLVLQMMEVDERTLRMTFSMPRNASSSWLSFTCRLRDALSTSITLGEFPQSPPIEPSPENKIAPNTARSLSASSNERWRCSITFL